MPSSYATYKIEDGLKSEGYKYIAGIDEVGRGPGAGPVVAAAVWIPEDAIPNFTSRIRDSKKISEKKRAVLSEEIRKTCKFGIGVVDNNIIDEINILNATRQAMIIALNKLEEHMPVDYVLVDGNVKLQIDIPYDSIIQGDTKSMSIAAASIIAKVERDEEMKTLHWIYPQYGWLSNKGYLTSTHIDAIEQYGITKYHRMSFRKVSDYVEAL